MSETTAGTPSQDAEVGVVRVRPVLREDVTRVFELLRELAHYEKLDEWVSGTPAMLEEALFGSGPKLEGLVAERNGTLIGYALFYPVYGSFRARWRMWLEDLFVEPVERGSGAGRLLMAELARIARERHWYAIDWEVLDWNDGALGFYRHLGATRIAADWHRYRLDEDRIRELTEPR